MADLGVPQVPLPRYDLPNPGLPFGQQAVSPVPQTNPLMALNSGIMGGGQLGLQAGALGLQAKELAQKQALQQAQVASMRAEARAHEQQSLVQIGEFLRQNFEALGKIDPDAAMSFYNEKMTPFHNAVFQHLGLPIQVNHNEIPQSHANVDTLKQADDLVQMALNDPNKVTASLYGLNKLNARMDVGELTRKKLEESTNTVKSINDNAKNQSDLFQGAKAEFDKQLSNRGGGLGLQDAKVNQATHLRTMINQNSATDPQTGQVTYHFPKNVQAELVLGLANLVSGSNMASVEQMKEMTPKTLRGDLSAMASYWAGQPFDSTPQGFSKQLVEQIDRQGSTAQQIRDTYQGQFVSSLDPRINPDNKKRLVESGRGVRFDDFVPGGKNATTQGGTIQRKGKDGKVYTYTLNPKTGKYE